MSIFGNDENASDVSQGNGQSPETTDPNADNEERDDVEVKAEPEPEQQDGDAFNPKHVGDSK